MDSKIAIIKTERYTYPKSGTFRPSVCYPEYLFKEDLSEKENHVYEMVRHGFALMGYDANNANTTAWNPLGQIIHPGNTVLLKPNMVMDINRSGGGTDCLYTQPSVVAAVMDYVLIALKGKGEVIIGDAPMQECRFDRLIQESGYDRLCTYYQEKVGSGIRISLLDFRGITSEVRNRVHYTTARENSSILVDLGADSEFSGVNESDLKRMRITNYDPAILQQHQTLWKHEYCINANVLAADVVVNLPKPKTHRKAGVTISMKNLVGINARKEFLPHHSCGATSEGGDEYLNPSICKRIYNCLLDKRNYYMQTSKQYKKANLLMKLICCIGVFQKFTQRDPYSEGNWCGNDTISRTIVDLNKIIYYADKNGVMQDMPQRSYLIVADMIISGEKEGPILPCPKEVGILAIGENPVCFDEVIAVIMGAKKEKINTLLHAREPKGKYILAPNELHAFTVSNDARWSNKTIEKMNEESILHFIPTSGWHSAFE